MATTVKTLNPAEARRYLTELAQILVDCVEGGASVSFMLPFALSDAEKFFQKVLNGLEEGDRTLFAAFDGDRVVGTVQLLISMPPNQPHRAEVSKLLVHRSARGKGVGATLMSAVEEQARVFGKKLLVLDTATGGDAERLYQRLNWNRVGVIPNFSQYPDGRWGDTTIFWKAV